MLSSDASSRCVIVKNDPPVAALDYLPSVILYTGEFSLTDLQSLGSPSNIHCYFLSVLVTFPCYS